jgi:hypothetical protein
VVVLATADGLASAGAASPATTAATAATVTPANRKPRRFRHLDVFIGISPCASRHQSASV